MGNKEKHCIDEEFANHIAEELNKETKKQTNDKLEKDFLERKEENDRYFYN